MFEVLIPSFLIGFSGAAAPGPMTAYVLGAGTRRPLLRAAGLVAGHGVPELAMVAAIAYGVREIPHAHGIALIGSCVLILFGIQQFRQADGHLNAQEETKKPASFGLLSTIANPYWWIWWLTFGVGFLALHPLYVEFFVGHIAADMVWFGMLAVLVGKGMPLLGKHYKRVVQASGIAMALFGLAFIAALVSV